MNISINLRILGLVYVPLLETVLLSRRHDRNSVAIQAERFKEQCAMYTPQQPEVFNHCVEQVLNRHLS